MSPWPAEPGTDCTCPGTGVVQETVVPAMSSGVELVGANLADDLFVRVDESLKSSGRALYARTTASVTGSALFDVYCDAEVDVVVTHDAGCPDASLRNAEFITGAESAIARTTA